MHNSQTDAFLEKKREEEIIYGETYLSRCFSLWGAGLRVSEGILGRSARGTGRRNHLRFRLDGCGPFGAGPELSEEALRESTIVGQMGIHPLITALESGAQYILAGRSCDIALFAPDMIRRGIDPGLAYHCGPRP